MKVAIFGAGTMGSGIAQVFAAKGHIAMMYASSVASAQRHRDKLAASLNKRVAKGKMAQEAVDAILNNILIEEKEAAAECDLVIECVKEDMVTIDEGLFKDVYDLKFRNDAISDYDVEDKLTNIKAKTLVVSDSENGYYSPEFDTHYPLQP